MLILCMQKSMNRFVRLMLSILVGSASHAHSTQNNKLTKSLQYLRKEVTDEVGFWCIQTSTFSTS